MQIINLTKNTLLADKAYVAASFKERLIGLLGRSSLEKSEALILESTSSIHTFGMKFDIDVLFVNRGNIVTGVYENLKPGRVSGIHPFSAAIELPSGTVSATQTHKGDLLQIK
ncbi:MAG: DUF192 domain-containing protein [Candidatus Omnitrophica bacterium]|nr:DUF192 domain-containing protein [Candidatus Omnitrophota bacterium]MDD5237150.1 DUF192 domain-containing protein [Candidatus Omnitrophota bacterium]MDD5610816.1 DUF192 domain-containing protein [Candidatus Omnitrophota bacterium]